MDQNAVFARCLEELNYALTEPEFDVDRTYAILKELCVAFRVCKGMAEYYRSEKEERNGEGVIRVCYDNGKAPEEVLDCRVVLNNLMIVNCKAFRAKGAEPWSATERARILMVERLMINVLGRIRMAGLIEQATLYDDAGYSNIRFFTILVERLGASGRLNRYAIVRFNLKHFSLINRQLGRDVTNRVLKQYIGTMEDSVSPEGSVSRLGGDNFVVVLLKEKLDRLLRILAGIPVEYDGPDGGRVMVSARAGIFSIPDDYFYHEFGDVMDRLTSAYNGARRGISGDFFYANEQLVEEKERAMRIRQAFPHALANKEFLVFYQPKVNVEDNSLAGAEALSRWFRDGKLIMPGEFIPPLEQTTDICRLDFYVLEQVCRDLRRWLDEGRQAVRVSVNMSRRHLMDMDLLSHILFIIDKYHVPHEYIEIELTEMTSDVEFRDLKRIVSGLQKEGVFTSVDDFGIGYSSLNLLKEIPWDILKVDRKFIPAESDSARDRQHIMFRHVVSMARELGLVCVAEGVETAGQLSILRENNCGIAQGFYFDKPLPVKEFEKRMDLHFYP